MRSTRTTPPKPGRIALVIFVLTSIGATLTLADGRHAAQSEFTASYVDRIVLGLTPRQEIRGWFGEPDAQIDHDDGTSRWVYRQARIVEADQVRETRRQYRKDREREFQAKQLADNTKVLVAAGHAGVRSLFDWIDRTFMYPPRPKRQASAKDDALTNPSVSAPNPTPPTVETAEHSPPMMDDSSHLAFYDLSVLFTSDGVVGEYQYRRISGREMRE